MSTEASTHRCGSGWVVVPSRVRFLKGGNPPAYRKVVLTSLSPAVMGFT